MAIGQALFMLALGIVVFVVILAGALWLGALLAVMYCAVAIAFWLRAKARLTRMRSDPSG